MYNVSMGLFSNATRQHIIATSRLMTPEMHGFIDLLELVLDDTKRSLVFADDTDHVRRLQGRARFIIELLNFIRESNNMLDKRVK